MSMDDFSLHACVNRQYWDAMAHEWVSEGERLWEVEEPSWGIWGLPESELGLLPGNMKGLRAIELGCGTGYVSAWMTRRGAEVTAIDVSPRQLATARRLALTHGLEISWVEGTAEATPFADASFDFAISEYGAAIWCDPYVWIPEAFRLLRPGGALVFLGHHVLSKVCSTENGASVVWNMRESYLEAHSFDYRADPLDPGGVEFALPISGWWALFRKTGFVVEDFQEPRPGLESPISAFDIPSAWARQFPSEQVWKLRKPGRDIQETSPARSATTNRR